MQFQNISTDLSANYIFSDNIDCSETDTWNGGTGFEKLGDSGNQFTGNLNGLGFTISDLYMYQSSETALLHQISSSSIIENIKFKYLYVRGTSTNAGLARTNNGIIRNSFFENAYVYSSGNTAAGVTSSNYGNITQIKFTGYVRGAQRTGAIASNHYAGFISEIDLDVDISGSYTSGGIVGREYGGDTSEIVIRGSVNGNSQGRTGGIIGYNSGRLSNNLILAQLINTLNPIGITSTSTSYFDNETETDFAGNSQGRLTADLTTFPHVADVYVGWNFDEIWTQKNGQYPTLRFLDEWIFD